MQRGRQHVSAHGQLASARGQVLLSVREQVRGHQLFEHRAGKVDAVARYGELGDQAGGRPDPADPEATPKGLAHRTYAHDAVVFVERRQRWRQVAAVEGKFQVRLVDDEQRPGLVGGRQQRRPTGQIE